MARYNKIYAGPAEQVKPQVVERPAGAALLPGLIAVIAAGKFQAAAAAATGRLYVVQDNYLTLKGVDDAYAVDETCIGIELMDDQLLNVRVPTATNVAIDAALTVGANGKVALAAAGDRVIGYAAEAYNNTTGADQLIHMRPANTRLAPAPAG